MTATEIEKSRVGLLFIHGIGEQPEGQTLWTFGEPLIHWLRHWVQTIHPDLPGKLAIIESILNPKERQLEQPAHACVEVTCGGPEGSNLATPHRWLLAESWWGSEIQRPAFRQLAGWMLTTGTWMIISHALWPLRLQQRTPWFFVRCVFVTLLALLVALFTQVGVLLLSLLAALPIPRLPKRFRRCC